MQDVEDVPPPRARRDHRVDAAAVEERADAIAVSAEGAREHRHELGGDRSFLDLRGAEVDRRAQVEQEPRGELALLVVDPDVGRLHACGDIPVDVADVIVQLVFAQIREIDAETAEERSIVAVEQAVEAAQDRPLEAAKDRLRRLRPL